MTEPVAVAWLRTALDRAEETAREASTGPWVAHRYTWVDDFEASIGRVYEDDIVGHGHEGGGVVQWADAVHIVAWNPTAVLAQVAADRELLDEHPNVNDGSCGTCVDGRWGYPIHGGSSPQRWPCRTLLLRAKAWGWKDEQHG